MYGTKLIALLQSRSPERTLLLADVVLIGYSVQKDTNLTPHKTKTSFYKIKLYIIKFIPICQLENLLFFRTFGKKTRKPQNSPR